MIWLRYSGSKKCLFVCLFVHLFVDLFVFYFNHLGTPTGIYPENFVKIGLDLAEILRISKLDWLDGERGKKEGRRIGGILLCNGLIWSVNSMLKMDELYKYLLKRNAIK